jgi:hypothetical protein
MLRYVQVSGAFFGLLAAMQLIRTVMRLPIQVGDVTVPVWASACAFVIASAFSIWAFRSARLGSEGQG